MSNTFMKSLFLLPEKDKQKDECRGKVNMVQLLKLGLSRFHCTCYPIMLRGFNAQDAFMIAGMTVQRLQS